MGRERRRFRREGICGYLGLIHPVGPQKLTASQSNAVQFRRSVVSDSLRPHGPQHARPPVHHQLPGSMQTHVRGVGDATQPSHPLASPSPPTFSLSQHQGLFQGVSYIPIKHKRNKNFMQRWSSLLG